MHLGGMNDECSQLNNRKFVLPQNSARRTSTLRTNRSGGPNEGPIPIRDRQKASRGDRIRTCDLVLPKHWVVEMRQAANPSKALA